MSRGPKTNFGASLGYFWYTESFDWPICTISQKTSTLKKTFVCFQGFLGTLLSFPIHNLSTRSIILLWYLWSISDGCEQFKHSLLPIWQDNFLQSPIWNLPKCTVHSWDVNSFHKKEYLYLLWLFKKMYTYASWHKLRINGQQALSCTTWCRKFKMSSEKMSEII